MAEVYLQDVLRTPRGAARDWGALKDHSPVDLLGGLFAYDPFELYEAGALSNPNAVVLGQIGRGMRV